MASYAGTSCIGLISLTPRKDGDFESEVIMSQIQAIAEICKKYRSEYNDSSHCCAGCPFNVMEDGIDIDCDCGHYDKFTWEVERINEAISKFRGEN